MTSSEKYNFKWNSFSDHALNLMRDMLLSPSYADVTLVCDDGKPIRAHKTILRACSSVFNDILELSAPPNSSHQPVVIFLRGIKHSEMEPLIDLIYTGSATFEKERLIEFLLVAKNLQIKDLCCIDEETGIENITSETEKETSLAKAESSFNPSERNHDQTEPDREKEETTKTNLKETNETLKEEAPEHPSKPFEDLSVISSIDSSTELTANLPLDLKLEQDTNYPQGDDKEESGFNQGSEDQLDPQDPSKENAKQVLRLKLNHSKDRSCPHCDFISNSAEINSLLDHILSKHEGVRYVCKYCGYKATQPSNLKRHIKYKHEGLRYECPHCESQLTTRSSLLRHMKSSNCGVI